MIALDEFVMHFAEQFEETDPQEITAQTEFRDLDEWESLIGLAIMNMVIQYCGVKITVAEFRSCATPEALYNLVASKA